MQADGIRKCFAENFLLRGELGASLSIWRDGEETLSLAGGFQDQDSSVPWHTNTPVLVWSATKGPAAATLLHALESADVSLSKPVSHIWPAFAAGGKRDVTLRMLLLHQTGLCALDNPPPVEDYEAVTAALAEQTPAWSPGTAHGYHPRTFGFLLDAVFRRLSGTETLGDYWSRIFAEPLGLEFWIGAPTEILPRVAPVFSPKGTLPKGDPFLNAFMTHGSLTSRSFASPKGLHSAAAMNTPAARTACYPGFGGIGTARALGKFYAMLAGGGVWNGRPFLGEKTLRLLERSEVDGPDKVLLMDTAFSCGFMKDPEKHGNKTRALFGPSRSAFGHPGAGGSVAFADPENRISFAYVMNQMEPGVLPNPRATLLIKSLYEAALGSECE